MRPALVLLLLSVPTLARSAEAVSAPALRPFTSLVPLMPLAPEDVPDIEVGLPWLPASAPDEVVVHLVPADENGYLVEGLSVCDPVSGQLGWGLGCSATARHLSLHGFILRLALARVSEDPSGYVVQDEDWSWRVLPDAQ